MRNPLEFIHKAPEVRINPTNYKLLALHIPLLREELGREVTKEDLQNMFPGLVEDYIETVLQVAASANQEEVVDKSLAFDPSPGKTTASPFVDRIKRSLTVWMNGVLFVTSMKARSIDLEKRLSSRLYQSQKRRNHSIAHSRTNLLHPIYLS